MFRKGYISIWILIILAGTNALACDHCGCDLGYGVLPTDNRSMVWLGYRYMGMSGTFLNEGSQSSVGDVFMRYEANLRKTFSRGRYEAQITMPFIGYRHYSNDYLIDAYNAPADASLMLRRVWQSTVICPWSHRLSAGLGVETPTGRHNLLLHESGGVVNPMMQPGSGSWDVLGQLNYSVRYNNWGLNIQTGSKWNNSSPEGWRQPWQYYTSAELLHQWTADSTLRLVVRCGGTYGSSVGSTYRGPEDFRFMSAQKQMLVTAGAEVYFNRLFMTAQLGTGRTRHLTELSNARAWQGAVSVGWAW